MTTDLEGAVERVKETMQDMYRLAGPTKAHAVPAASTDLYLILDALASITGERDALKAEADETNGLLEEMRRQLTIAQDERDAMREGLKPFAELANWYARQEDDSFEVQLHYPHGGPRNLLRLGNFRRAAALVNGEGGE